MSDKSFEKAYTNGVMAMLTFPCLYCMFLTPKKIGPKFICRVIPAIPLYFVISGIYYVHKTISN